MERTKDKINKRDISSIIDMIDDIVLVSDNKGGIVFANFQAREAFAQITDDISVADLLQDFDIQHHDCPAEYFESVISGKTPPSEKTIIYQKDNESGNITNAYELSIKPFNDNSDSYLILLKENAKVGLVKDLEDRVKNLQTLLDRNPETHFLMDLEGKVLNAGSSTAKRLNTELDNLIGKNIYELISPELAEERKEHMRRCIAGKTIVEFYDERNGIYFHNIMYPILNAKGNVYRVAVFAHDYTQRYHYENTINESRELLSRSEKIVKIGTWKLDLKELRVSYSKGFAQIMEYPDESREHPLQELLNIIAHPDNSDELNQLVKSVLDDPTQPREFEHKVRIPSGKIKILYTKAEPVYDNEGEVKCYQGVTHDITGTKEVEEELKLNKARFDSVLSSLPVFFFSTDKEGVITLAEGKGLELLGVNPEEEVGTSLYKKYGRLPRAKQIISDVLKGKPWRGAFRFNKHIFDLHLNPILDVEGEPDGIGGVASDITEKYRAEKDFRQLVENSLQGIVVIQNASIPFANPEFCNTIGYTRDELKEMKPYEVRSLIFHKDRQKAFETLRDVMLEKISGERLITRIVSKCGEYRWVDVGVSKIRYKGEPAIQAFFVDVSDKLKAEQALRESEANLLAILNSTLQSFIYLDSDKKIKTFNTIAQKTNEKIWGGKLNVGDSIFDIISPEHVERFNDYINRSLKGEFVETNEKIIDHNDSVMYVKVNFNPVFDANNDIIGVSMNTVDTTELENAKVYLEESERRYRGLIESQTDLVVRTDKEGGLTFVNEAYRKKFGKENESVIGNKFLPLVHKKETAIAPQIIKRLENPPYRMSLEHRALSAKGWRWISWECYGIHTSDGKVEEIQAVGRDITDRKLTEEALRISEEKQRSILNSMDDLVLALDSRGMFAEFYQSGNMQLYRAPNEFMGKHYTEILPEEVSQQLSEAIEKIILTNTGQQFEYSLSINNNKNYYSAKISPRTNIDGTFAGVTIVVRDITQLNKSMKQLQESEEKFRELAENINDVFWIRENDKVVYVSPAYEKIWGQPREYLYDNNYAFVDGIHEDDRERVLSEMKEDGYFYNGKFDQEYRVVNKNGEIRWLWARTYPVLEDGEVKRTVGVAEDITLRKKAEEEIHHALEQATELSELKSRFISMVSHEFRTPLSTISLSAELLEAFGDSESPEEREKHFKSIEKSIDYLTELLDDVITINRADAGRLSSKIEEVDIINYSRTLVEETMQSFQTHPNVKFDSNKEACGITTDVKLIRHIITNLVSNAVKYTPDEKNIYVYISIRNTSFEIKIRDEGIGIPFKDQKELFQPFFRAKNTNNIPGSGLGLAITKRFVDLIGGDITFNSKVGIGTEFSVVIPLEIDGDE